MQISWLGVLPYRRGRWMTSYKMLQSAQCCLLTLVLLVPALAEQTEYTESDGGWQWNNYSPLQEEDRCTVERRDASITYAEFIDRYAYRRPVILRGLTDNSVFQSLCRKEHLLRAYGDRHVRLSTANTYSYEKVDVPFREYLDHLLRPQDLNSLGCDTLYFFGDNNFTEWGSLFQKYTPPPFKLPGTTGAYSFGIAGSGTGVPFHWHGPGFSEVIYGRKRWFLYPPDKTPEFNPNRTTVSWMMDTYPFLPAEDRPIECTIRPGEVLYFPDRWWHATLNLDTSVFISTFLG
ncbi:jmjC domain-containing protein 8 isoform X2 [Pseudophryne corroboree]|uniref:jmjC domain-containing protein 8 isoform X2 n=1 Tax=Pseudophryne corroboree TaxID=495146 RepID=UPI0030814691